MNSNSDCPPNLVLTLVTSCQPFPIVSHAQVAIAKDSVLYDSSGISLHQRKQSHRYNSESSFVLIPRIRICIGSASRMMIKVCISFSEIVLIALEQSLGFAERIIGLAEFQFLIQIETLFICSSASFSHSLASLELFSCISQSMHSRTARSYFK